MSVVRVAFAAVLFVLVAVPAVAQEAEDCLNCHGDQESLSGIPDGKRLFVDPEMFPKSLHGDAGLSCVHCHTELIGTEKYPHKKDVRPVKCDT